jgi:membrane protease YdiL (CAAX protease family)
LTTSSNKLSGFLSKHAVAAYVLLAIALGGGIIFLVAQGVLPSNLTLMSTLSASIAGIVLTSILDGRAGLKTLLHRLLIWRVGIGYWLFAFLFVLPVLLLGFLTNPLFGGDPLSLSSIHPPFPLLPMFLIFFLVAGVGEELGWTGFLIPRLQARYSALTSSIIRGVLWGFWHVPLWLYARLGHPAMVDIPYGGWIAQKGFWPAIGVFFLLFVIPWSVIYTWIFNNTRGSLLLVSVLHGSEIFVAYGMLSTGIDQNNLNNYWGYGGLLLGFAILLVFITGAINLSRTYDRIIHTASR